MATKRTDTEKSVNTHPRALAVAVSAALLPWGHAYALPTGEQVVAGQVTVTHPSSRTMQIDQGTQKGIVNWQGFSIGASEHVNVSQLDAASVLLNRVVGNNPSEIFGRLTANGQVFLVNNAGVLFAPSARVEVGSLFATSLSINDQDFLAGRYQFYNPGNAGSVVNQGSIVTANGYTALVGPQVRNDGVIVARAGSVALAAADRVSLDMIGDGLISVSVDQATLNAAVVNTGTITADGGTILLAARSANALLDTVINNSGVIRANSLVERNGGIVLDGGSAGTVANSGTLQAAGTDGSRSGGTVKVLGEHVALLSGSRVDASGDAGGGTVLVGGNFHGGGSEPHASSAFVDANSVINADAITSGDGGEIAVWSDGSTHVAGTISARGANSGNGGFIETSGVELKIADTTRVNTLALNGVTGMWLLDPPDFLIAPALGDATGAAISTNLATTDVTILSSAGGGGANGDVIVSDTITWSSGQKLTLSAFRDVVVTPISGIIDASGGAGNLDLIADNTGTGTGTVTIPLAQVTMGTGTASVYYNPVTYATLTGYSAFISGGTTNSFAWTFIDNTSAIAENKVYDGTTTATLDTPFTFLGDPTGGGANAVTLTAGSANFADRNAVTGKTVTFSGYALGGADANKFALFAQAANQTADISQRALTVTAVTDTKTYDGTTSSTGAPTHAALQTGDTTTTFIQTFDDRNAGTNKTLTATGVVNDGNGGANYTYTFVNDTTGVINVRPITATAASDTKTYDGTTASAAAPIITGGLGTGDTSGFAQTFDNRNAGTNKTLTAAGVVNDGNSGNNYSVTFVTDTTGVINVRPITVTAQAATKVYDGNTNSGTAPAIAGGLGAGDTSGFSQAYDNKNVGTSKTLMAAGVVNDGNGGNNYSVTFVAGTNGAITRLSSVTWTGAGDGVSWSDAVNWGGAIPDLANVASVNLGGSNVTFTSAVPALAGSVQVDNVSGGALTMSSGTLAVAVNGNLTGYGQSGGTLSAGSLTVSSAAPISQTGGGMNVTGASSFSAGGNAITLTGANDFQGPVSLTGGTTQITDANALTLGTVNVGALTTVNTGALNLGALTASSLNATTNGGNITQSGSASISGTTQLQAGSGSIVLPIASNDFGGAISGGATGGIQITDSNSMTFGGLNGGSSNVVLAAAGDMFGPGFVSGGTGLFSSSGGADTQVTNLGITFSGNVTVTGSATLWNFSAGSSAASFSRTSDTIGVQIGGVTFLANVVQIQAGNVIGSVSAAAAAVIVEEANKTFGTDSVAEDVEYGFAGEIGATPPMDHRIEESGISLPRCVQEAREGLPCK